METHSSILAWKIPWTGEPGGLQSMGFRGVRACTPPLIAKVVKNPPAMQETPVQLLVQEDPLEKGKAIHSSILAGEFHGPYSPWGRKESDTTEHLSLHSGPTSGGHL